MSQKSRAPKKRSKARPRQRHNRDHCHRCQMSVPAIEEIEKRIALKLNWENGQSMKELKGFEGKQLRSRKLNLEVMVAIVISLVYRQINSLSEAVRILKLAGLAWVKPQSVSKQALSQRLQSLPASVLASVCQSRPSQEVAATEPKIRAERQWLKNFSCVWIADGSTLEALKKKKLQILREYKCVLGGKMMVVVDMFSHAPVAVWYREQAKANDKLWCDQLLAQLPKGGLLVFDLGFFKFAWFDEFTQTDKFFLTRFREKTAFRVSRTQGSGLYFSDRIIELGEYRSNPCRHQLRLVSVLWGDTWYYYLTNVLDPQMLSAQQVCDLYRRRWRLEDAFRLTKRLLGLSYLWVGDTNGVQIQLLATWMVYEVLNDLCTEVAIALEQPLEVISLELIFRALAHFAQAVVARKTSDLIAFLVAHHRLLGLVKARRKRHRAIEAQSRQIWALTS